MNTLETRNDPEVLAAHRAEFLRFLERRVGSRDVAEDILQDTFAQSLEKLGTLRDSDALVAWFYQALRNASVDYHRRRRRTERVREQLRQEDEPIAASAEAALAKTCGCATRVAGGLKPEYSDAIRRLELEGASLKTFAAERGISATNAAVRVFRARDALRRALVALCGTEARRGCGPCGCETRDVPPSGAVRGPYQASQMFPWPGKLGLMRFERAVSFRELTSGWRPRARR